MAAIEADRLTPVAAFSAPHSKSGWAAIHPKSGIPSGSDGYCRYPSWLKGLLRIESVSASTRLDFIILDDVEYPTFAKLGGQFLFHLICRLGERDHRQGQPNLR